MKFNNERFSSENKILDLIKIANDNSEERDRDIIKVIERIVKALNLEEALKNENDEKNN